MEGECKSLPRSDDFHRRVAHGVTSADKGRLIADINVLLTAEKPENSVLIGKTLSTAIYQGARRPKGTWSDEGYAKLSYQEAGYLMRMGFDDEFLRYVPCYPPSRRVQIDLYQLLVKCPAAFRRLVESGKITSRLAVGSKV